MDLDASIRVVSIESSALPITFNRKALKGAIIVREISPGTIAESYGSY